MALRHLFWCLRGHFRVVLASKKALEHVLTPKIVLKCKFLHSTGQFSVCVSAPKKALKYKFPQGGQLSEHVASKKGT